MYYEVSFDGIGQGQVLLLQGVNGSNVSTAGWETVSIPFQAMEATFHGESVNVPNYAGENIVEMQLLIGNKKEENFELLISKIEAI